MTMPVLSAASGNSTHRLLLAVFAMLLFLASPASAQATQPAPNPDQHDHTAPAVPDQPAAQPADKHQMHDMHGVHTMMAAMQASHARLQDLVTKMNAAQGAAKIDAIAAVVTELVASQHAMHECMQSHMAQMMGTMKMPGAAAAKP